MNVKLNLEPNLELNLKSNLTSFLNLKLKLKLALTFVWQITLRFIRRSRESMGDWVIIMVGRGVVVMTTFQFS